jgi:hypothetical protein
MLKSKNQKVSTKSTLNEDDVVSTKSTLNEGDVVNEKEKLATSSSYAKKIFIAIKHGTIDMGEKIEQGVSEQHMTEKWFSKPLQSGAVVNFIRTKKLTPRTDGKKHNPRYILNISHNGKKQEFCGEWARKTYIALTKHTRKKTDILDEKGKIFCNEALADIL